jgi:SsrA-binding protein
MPKKNKAKKQVATAVLNKRANYDFALDDRIKAGLVLTGAETKAIRLGRAIIKGSYVQVINNELWLVGAQVHGTQNIRFEVSEVTRNRKLLVKSKQREELIAAKKQGLQIIPTALLTKTRYIKLEIATGKGKKNYDKRESIKKRDTGRDAARALATYS